jgi:hypothetical protein
VQRALGFFTTKRSGVLESYNLTFEAIIEDDAYRISQQVVLAGSLGVLLLAREVRLVMELDMFDFPTKPHSKSTPSKFTRRSSTSSSTVSRRQIRPLQALVVMMATTIRMPNRMQTRWINMNDVKVTPLSHRQ